MTLVPFRWVKEDFRCHSKEMPLQGVHNGPWELLENSGLAAAKLEQPQQALCLKPGPGMMRPGNGLAPEIHENMDLV